MMARAETPADAVHLIPETFELFYSDARTVYTTTGKPCKTVFSRPYDLTRHEDTIHDARKQKVHCAPFQEEKMSSRTDALTRRMSVVHPVRDGCVDLLDTLGTTGFLHRHFARLFLSGMTGR